ncbi:hypothetical protein BGX26_007027 [Mortierella sp. AD094]|nr:hypothetical protein BGX26_007027 [Mortierella sp. AD094]
MAASILYSLSKALTWRGSKASTREPKANPKDPVQKRLDNTQNGGQRRIYGDFKEAAKHFKLAIKSLPDKANDRQNEIPLRKPSQENETSSGNFSKGLKSRIKRVEDTVAKIPKITSQKPTLYGPFFPQPAPSSSLATSAIQTSSMSQISLKIDDTDDEALSTSSLVTSFLKADVTTRNALRSHIQEVIIQFDNNSIPHDTIHELVVMATIPDIDIFRNIIDQMLQAFKESPHLPSEILQGLAVILNSCPEQIDLTSMQRVFLDILDTLTDCLENICREQNDSQSVPLLRAIATLLDAMVCRDAPAINSQKSHSPLKEALGKLMSLKISATVRFLAQYANQALALIGNDETLAKNIFHRDTLAFAIVVNRRDTAHVHDLNNFELAYQNFPKINLTLPHDWYLGLIYLDCVIGRKNWQQFEAFVPKSKLKSDKCFLQGVCLRLEQIVVNQSNESVRLGAIKFLQGLESSLGLVKQAAQDSLQRVGINMESKRSSIGTPPSKPIPRSIGLPPVWDFFWQAAPSNILLKRAQVNNSSNTSNTALPSPIQDIKQETRSTASEIKQSANKSPDQSRKVTSSTESDIREPVERLPEQARIDEVHAALKAYYDPLLTIQRVSGDTLDLKACYINLAIVEAPGLRQRNKGELNTQAATFHRMASYERLEATDMKATLCLEEIFNKRKLRDEDEDEEIPKTILIQGRAGIGKTTLCKKIVHAYQIEKYFPQHPEQERRALVTALADQVLHGRVLFVLDGLDEIVINTQAENGIKLRVFLDHLFKQSKVVITSRPSGVDKTKLPRIDLELETVGFSQQNVNQYLAKVLNPETARSVQDFIRKTPLMQSLVNIPVQLDVICYSWDYLPSKEDSVTMTRLYETMVRKLWCKDAERLQKSVAGNAFTPQQINSLRLYQIDQLMSIESEYLGYLAFKGMRDDHQIEFDETALLDAMEDLDQHRKTVGQDPLPLDLLDSLKQTSFLHTADMDPDSIDRKSQHQVAWHFLHLTFQEYFAATWLAKQLQIKQPNVIRSSVSMMTMKQAREFLQQHRYNPRYEIFWWMVAGQLEGSSLDQFFDLLQGASRDLVGGRHQQLLAGCLKQARLQLNNIAIQRLEENLMKWLRLETMLFGEEDCKSTLGRQSFFPEELPVMSLSQAKAVQIYDLRAFKGRSHLTSSAMTSLISALHQEDLKDAAYQVLRAQSTLSESAIQVLIGALHDEDRHIRDSVCNTLCSQFILSEPAIQSLFDALQEGDWDIKDSVCKILGTQSTLPESAILALIGALQDENWVVKDSVRQTLCTQSSLSESAIQSLINMLQKEDRGIRDSVCEILGTQFILSESAIQALVDAVQYGYCGTSACQALSSQSKLSDSAIQALIGSVQHGDWGTSACQALGAQSKLSESTIEALVGALQEGYCQDENWHVRNSACKALGAQSTLSELAIQALTEAWQDKDETVMNSACIVLQAQTLLSDSATQALIHTLKHENTDTRSSACKAFGAHSTLPESVIQALISALRDKDNVARDSACRALGTQSTLPDSTLQDLVNSLQEGNWDIKDSICNALRTRSKLPASVIQAIIPDLKNKHWYIRDSACKAFGTQSALPRSAIQALIFALQDKDDTVRDSACKVLRAQSTLSKSVIQALAGALQDSDRTVRDSAYKALGTQSALPKSTAMALIKALFDNYSEVRVSAAGALGAQSKLRNHAILALTKVIQDKDQRVGNSAVRAISTQSPLPESTILALAGALIDFDDDSRSLLTKTLGIQAMLPGSVIRFLLNNSQDIYLVKGSAIKVLDKHHHSICMAVPELSTIEIIQVYKNHLFGNTDEKILSLYFQGDQLCFYTAHGPGKIGPVCKENRKRVISAFRSVQNEAGIYPMSAPRKFKYSRLASQ